MAKTLTAVAVKNYRPGKERREIRDGGCAGLHLVIQPQPSGAKSWALRFRRPSGKPAKLTLGPVDLSGSEVASQPVLGMPLTLASARRLAADIHHQRATGRDVVADHEAAKRRRRFEQETRDATIFDAAARDFIEGHAKKKTRRWQEQARMLGLRPTAEGLEVIRGGLVERWRDKPVTEIDGHDVFGVVDETRRTGVPGLERRSDGPTEPRARAMFACLSKMFSWLLQRRRVDKNPCAGVHRPDAPMARDRVLTDAEVVKFWWAADSERKEFSALLKILLLTGSRLSEVAGMLRAELSEDYSTWNIPGGRTKNRRPHLVPLSPLVRKLIADITEDRALDGQLVFSTSGDKPISGWSKIKKRLDRKMAIPPWRLHDLRRTAATGMAELGIAPHIVEAALNHVSGAKAGVAGTYNRAAYASEKKAALDKWASHVEDQTSRREDKVVSMHRSWS